MSAYDDFINLVKGEEYLAKATAFGQKVKDDIAGIITGSLTDNLVYSANVQTLAVDKVLTVADVWWQVLNFTVAGKSVTMPDATTLVQGKPWTLEADAASYGYTVDDNGGNFIAYVSPGTAVTLNLSDKTTANGVWKQFPNGLLSGFEGVLNTDANYVDFVKFGPAVDRARGGKGMSNWNRMFGAEAVMADIMIAAVRVDGSDYDLEIWDATDPAGTKLKEITVTGAVPTCITAAGPFIMVGCDAAADGLDCFTPFSGDWAEQTYGWPRSVDNQVTPGLSAAIVDVDSGFQRVKGLSHLPWNHLYNGPQPLIAFSQSNGRPGAINNIIPDVMAGASLNGATSAIAVFEDRVVYKDASGPLYISDPFGEIEDDTNADWNTLTLGYDTASARGDAPVDVEKLR